MRIVALAHERRHWREAARVSYESWRHEFPDDTEVTYLDQYAHAADPGDRLVEVYAALSDDDQLLALATLVDDDELPGVTEPGPWLAAVWVRPSARRRGIGSAIVAHVTARATELGLALLFLYTEDRADWYESMGWRRIREASVNGLTVTVMSIEPDSFEPISSEP